MGNHVCQSCGMPLYKPEMFGTDSKGAAIEDYCLYCYQDGQFTSDVTMNEMIKLCSKYVESQGGLKEEYIKNMQILYPTLKRWAQKEDTQAEYYKSVNKALDYINNHLNETITLETLAGITNISPYHFHRIFKAVIGENISQYIQRLRLEYVAHQLQTSSESLEILAEATGYQSTQSLSKAFKKRFEIPPSIYKQTPNKWTIQRADQLFPRICKIYPKHLIYLNRIESSMTYPDIWRKLYSFSIFSKLLYEGSESIGACFDFGCLDKELNPEFRPCLSIEYPVLSNKHISCTSTENGIYAVFTHHGSYINLPDLYKSIWFIWLPQSRYLFRKGIIFEKYLNNPDNTEKDKLLTEVYIPICPKKA